MAALLVHFLLAYFPYSIIDKLYTSGIYTVMKWLLWPFHALPFPALHLFVVIIISILTYRIYQMIRSKKTIKWGRTALQFLHFMGFIIFFFYLLWGYNYRSTPIKERLDLPSVGMDTTEFLELYRNVTNEMINVRSALPEDTLTLLPMSTYKLSGHIDSLERQWLSGIGIPTGLPAKVRALPPGLLLRISTAGFYFPLAGEGYYDGGLHPIAIPFVIAHELAHNYGITDEGEANFVAFRTCMASPDPFIRYSAMLDLWQYLAVTYRFLDESAYTASRDTLPAFILNDLQSIRRQHAKYPDIFPDLRDHIYSFYLQSQGVSSGLQSYGQVIQLEMAYRKKYPSRK